MGGDLIDMIDEFFEVYKKIVVFVVEVLGVKISGIDLIILDKEIDFIIDKKVYGIIEVNFNLVMYMYVYFFVGKGRRLMMNVLKLLYFEIF